MKKPKPRKPRASRSPSPKNNWSAAARHLRKVDPVMRGLIDCVGPCRIGSRRDYFVCLCESIFSQQISGKIADILFGRFRTLFPRQRPTPAAVLHAFTGGLPEERLRICGLSRQKRAYIVDLSQHFVDNRIPTRRLASMTDEQVIEALTAVKGIGRWTAEMFLMFVLNRPDVLPVDDLGVREGVRVHYGLRSRPDAARVRKIAGAWAPWRSVGTWYIWRGLTHARKAKAG